VETKKIQASAEDLPHALNKKAEQTKPPKSILLESNTSFDSPAS